MSLSPLTPLAGVAAGSLVAGAANLVGESLAFAQTLIQGLTGQNHSADHETDKFVSINDRKSAIESLQAASRKALQNLHKAISQKLAAVGIDTSGSIDLRVDGHGDVLVTSYHPRRANIEQTLKNDPALQSLIDYLVSNNAFIQSQETGERVDESDLTVRVSRDETQILFEH